MPVLPIGAFAGLRMAGILRLDWTEVDHVGGYIEFTARKSNSFQHKLIKIIAIPYLGSSTVCLEEVVVQCREVEHGTDVELIDLTEATGLSAPKNTDDPTEVSSR